MDAQITDKKRGFNEKSLKNLKPIKPGEVRNPRGRPPKADCLISCIKKELEQKTPNGKTTKEQMIAMALVDKAQMGDLNAIKILMEYIVIKPAQQVEMTGKDGAPLVPTIVVETPKAKELTETLLKGGTE